jgi:DNA polymerase III psi subunit
MSKLLEDGFRKDLRIILVVDELSTEQKDTMNNVIKAFKLENGESIQFKGYVVRLEQKINLTDGQTEYAISVQ